MNPKQFTYAWGALAFAAALNTANAADAPNVTGTWKWTTQTRNGGTREVSMNLIQEGNKVTGSVTGRRGDMEITEGNIQNSQLDLNILRETQRGNLTIHYTGKVTDDQIDGNVQMQFGDRSFEREWQAKRVPADPTGVWLWTMQRDDGQSWESKMALKRENGELTGLFSREDRDWQIPMHNVKVQGNQLTFQTRFERDGNTIVIENQALIAGDTMRGKSRRVGGEEDRTREWKAVRQKTTGSSESTQ